MDHGQYLVSVHILIVAILFHLYSNAQPIQIPTNYKLILTIAILSEILFLFTVSQYQVKYNQYIFIMSFVLTSDNRKCETNYDVRLVGGNDTSEGTVEICHGGVWNSFCSGFDYQLAATICYQLGYRKSKCMKYCFFYLVMPQIFFRFFHIQRWSIWAFIQ